MIAKLINHKTSKEEVFLMDVVDVHYDWRKREVVITDLFDNTYTYSLKDYDLQVLGK